MVPQPFWRRHLWKIVGAVLAVAILGIILFFVLGREGSEGSATNQNNATAIPEPVKRVNVTDSTLLVGGENNYYHRLPRNVVPESYHLTLRTNIQYKENALIPEAQLNRYEGKVAVKVVVNEPTSEIELHSVNLNWTRCEYRKERSVEVPQTCSFKQSVTEPNRMILTFPKELEKGEVGTLSIEYSSALGDHPKGYFFGSASYSSYPYTATMNEPMGARLMVPCFDEPSLKATWTVVMEHPANTIALANTERTGTEQMNCGFLRSYFETTEKMSSYLLSLSVSQHQKSCVSGVRNITICKYTDPADLVYFPAQKDEQILYVARKTIEIMESITNQQYSYRKLDLLSAANYFGGALENWGLIGFISHAFDHDVVIHEIVHQWFGNLVTAENWGHIWLNEGITTYLTCVVQEKMAEKAQIDDTIDSELKKLLSNSICGPEYNLTEVVVVDHPPIVNFDADSGEGIYFDGVEYLTVASILRMTEKLIGMDIMKKTLQDYLVLNSFDIANSGSFIDVLKANLIGTNHSDAADLFKDWMHKKGSPVVLVKRKDNATVVLEIGPKIPDTRYITFDENWTIPVFYTIGNGNKYTLMLTEGQSESIKVSESEALAFDLFNTAAYYLTDRSILNGHKESILYPGLHTYHSSLCTKLRFFPDDKRYC